MADEVLDPIADRALERMLDAGLADGHVGRIEYQDGETPGLVDADTVTAMAQELLQRRRADPETGPEPPRTDDISGMVVIEAHELRLDPEALIEIVKLRTMDMAAGLLDMAAEVRERRKLQ